MAVFNKVGQVSVGFNLFNLFCCLLKKKTIFLSGDTLVFLLEFLNNKKHVWIEIKMLTELILLFDRSLFANNYDNIAKKKTAKLIKIQVFF